MGLLRDIQGAATTSSIPVSDVLRMTKALASDLANPLLTEWADQELVGYPPDAEMPTYRRRRQTKVQGTFEGLRYTAHDILPIDVEESCREGWLFYFTYADPAALYEAMLAAHPGDIPDRRSPWPLPRITFSFDERKRCIEAWRVLPRVDVMEVLDGVRNRILDLIIRLGREAPEAGDAPSLRRAIPSDAITHLVYNAIYAGVTMSDHSINVGDDFKGNLTGGENNRVRQREVSINEQGADIDKLVRILHVAVEKMAGQISPEDLDAVNGLVDELTHETAEPRPVWRRIGRALKAIATIARPAGDAGSAVISAAHAIESAIGS